MATKKYRPYLSLEEMCYLIVLLKHTPTPDVTGLLPATHHHNILATLTLQVLKVEHGFNTPALTTNPIEDRLGFGDEEINDATVSQLMEAAAKKNRPA